MLASTWTDMVMGVDIHFEMVPTPAGPIPTPFPNPFIGVVYDPIGMTIGLAIGAGISAAFGGPITGPVMMYGVFPATNVGTEAKGMGHILIPPGASWMPMPKFPKPSFKGPPELPGLPVKPEDDAVAIMGSKTVNIMGASQVRLAEMWMSCGEPLRAPSSVVIATPKGGPILVGGPPAVDLLTALTSMIKTKWVAGYLHSLIDRLKPGRLRNILHWVACKATGHPVDVASGRVFTHHVDWELPGPLPLRFERVYFSSWSDRAGCLGNGWSHSLDEAVWSERGKIVYMTGDGREIEFDTFDLPNHVAPPGTEIFEPKSRLTLRLEGNGAASITTHDGLRSDFVSLRDTAPPDRRHWLRLKRRTDRAGQTIELDYDRRGNLEWVTDSGGRQVCFEYDAQNRLVLVKLPHPTERAWLPHTRYTYDANGDLVQVTDPLGHSWRFEYKKHLLVREADRNGFSFYFAYDGYMEDAYCVRTWGDGGIYDHVIDYDKKGKVTFVTNSLGQTTTYHMNAIGLVTKVVNPHGACTTYEYDERTLAKVKETGPLGEETCWIHDERGNCCQTVLPDGSRTQSFFDDHNQLVRFVDAMAGEWEWQHDTRGLPTRRLAPGGGEQTFTWNQGLLELRRLAPDRRLAFGYDAQRNLTTVTLPNGRQERYAVDNLGRIVQITNAGGGETRIVYDPAGRVVETRTPTGTIQQLTYDCEGNLLEVKDDTRRRRFGRTRDRVAWQEEAGVRTQFVWNTECRLTAIVNEHGERFEVVLDAAGNVSEEVGFDGRRRRYERDPAGRVAKLWWPSGRVTEYSYDARGRLAETKTSDGRFARFTRDARGLVIAAENESGRVEVLRDAAGRVVAERVGEHEVRSRYGHEDERVEVETSLGARARMVRNPMGRVQEMVIGRGGRDPDVRWEYDALSVERSLRYGNGIRVAWKTDIDGRPLARHTYYSPPHPPEGQASAPVPPCEIDARAYQWRGEEQIATIIDTVSGPHVFDHDDRGRLVRERHAEGSTERAVDAAGNVYRSSDRRDRSYGPGGRLLSADAVRYAYDEDGNQTEKTAADGSTWKYQWNGHGALRAVLRPDGTRVEFEYDAFVRRIAKRTLRQDGTLSSETRFVWDGPNLVHELDSEAGLLTWYWHPNGITPIAKRTAGHTYMIVADQIGAPTEMYDESGALAWKMNLDVFGQARFSVGSAGDCPWRWPGQYEDLEHGAAYQRTRYYDAFRGTFISPDPAGLFAGLNQYQYVPDPLTWLDILGLTGTYIFLFSDGNTYVGKGPIDRSIASQGIRAKEVGLTPGDIVQGAHRDFGSSDMGLMVEAELMRRNSFGNNPNLLNAINSPGEKMLQNATPAQLAAVKANADALEQDFQQSQGKICK